MSVGSIFNVCFREELSVIALLSVRKDFPFFSPDFPPPVAVRQKTKTCINSWKVQHIRQYHQYPPQNQKYAVLHLKLHVDKPHSKQLSIPEMNSAIFTVAKRIRSMNYRQLHGKHFFLTTNLLLLLEKGGFTFAEVDFSEHIMQALAYSWQKYITDGGD